MQKSRNWRTIFLVSIVTFGVFSGLIAYQLWPRTDSQPTVLGPVQKQPKREAPSSLPVAPKPQEKPKPATSTTSSTTSSTTTVPPKAIKPEVKQTPAPSTVAPTSIVRPTQGCIEGDCQNGVGTFIYGDGGKYTGHWLNGKMHGEGHFRLPSGGEYKGKWKNGRLSAIQ
ncbi:MAG: hypothetical protein HQL94_11170 [Magnetococcales bacterium]|nr:hypothetical protein [Magnetococcales bacterium]MBF0439200.1 hypothetical protein [Magnetococcales bacterium]